MTSGSIVFNAWIKRGQRRVENKLAIQILVAGIRRRDP